MSGGRRTGTADAAGAIRSNGCRPYVDGDLPAGEARGGARARRRRARAARAPLAELRVDGGGRARAGAPRAAAHAVAGDRGRARPARRAAAGSTLAPPAVRASARSARRGRRGAAGRRGARRRRAARRERRRRAAGAIARRRRRRRPIDPLLRRGGGRVRAGRRRLRAIDREAARRCWRARRRAGAPRSAPATRERLAPPRRGDRALARARRAARPGDSAGNEQLFAAYQQKIAFLAAAVHRGGEAGEWDHETRDAVRPMSDAR